MGRGVPWDYFNPVQVLFGPGRVADLWRMVAGRTLLVTTPGMTRRGMTQRILGGNSSGTAILFDRTAPNPEAEAVQEAVRELTRHRVEAVIGLGGGSTLDFAKALALGLADPSRDILGAIQSGTEIEDGTALPLVSVPTTAGTGSEVTPFATFWERRSRRKFSLSGRALFPRAALLDPELTLSLPWNATLAPGLDALCQCFESIWNRNANPVTVGFATRGIRLIPNALRALRYDLTSLRDRTAMLESSLCSGLAISRTRTALAHSISYPVTGAFGVPHGLACGFTLPAVLEFNLAADDGRLERLARELGAESGMDLVKELISLFGELGVAEEFRRFVPDFSSLHALVPEMLTPGRAGNNLRNVTSDSIRSVLDLTERWLFSGQAVR